MPVSETTTDHAGLLLYGASAIAKFLGLTERQVRHRVRGRRAPDLQAWRDCLCPGGLPGRVAREARSRGPRRRSIGQERAAGGKSTSLGRPADAPGELCHQ